MKELDEFLERDRDRELFDLAPKKENADGNPTKTVSTETTGAIVLFDSAAVLLIARWNKRLMGIVYHSILREIGFKKNLSSRVVRTECARRNGWAGPGFGKS